MKTRNTKSRAFLGTAIAAAAFGIASIAATPAAAQPKEFTSGTYRPSAMVALSVGEGQMITLPRSVSNVWVSNPKVADVFINNSRQLNLFGKDFGEATVIATAADGSVVYGAQVRVSQNLPSITALLQAAMPDADIHVTVVGQTAILSGTVASPDDAAFADRLANRELNPGVDMTSPGAQCKICVLNRLRTATPLQVMLKVRIAEVNRSMLKKIGVNLLNRGTGNTLFGIGQGSPGSITTQTGTLDPVTGKLTGSIDPASGALPGQKIVTFNNLAGATTLGLFGHIFGTDLLGTLDLMQNDGFVSTLAEPTLTALSGETASFLAGGEFPIPISQGNNAVTIEYKQYGVGLAFTPIVLSDGRISMRVRPEVSELSTSGSVTLNGFVVPALTTRRAETTVELGSGQSFMLAGLLSNKNNNAITKAPFLGDLPILGALFRSTSYQRDETELVIIVTPYLVRPTSGRLSLPTDGYRAPTDVQQILGGQVYSGVSGPPATVPAPGPALPGAASSAAAPGFKL